MDERIWKDWDDEQSPSSSGVSTGTLTPIDKPRVPRWKFAVASLGTLALVSTVSQYTAALVFGIAEYVQWGDLSTGGVVGFLTAVIMWWKCADWATWRKWVLVPAAFLVLIAFLLIGQGSQALKAELLEIERQEQEISYCIELRAELDQLTTYLEAKLSRWENRTNTYSWETGPFNDVSGEPIPEYTKYKALLAQYSSNC